MEADSFLDVRRHPAPAAARAWLPGLAKTAAGAAILWLLLPRLPQLPPLAAGWLGMIGLILLMHFGGFDLLARLWQLGGVDARPIMNRPLLARSLSDFWGSRWNLGFRQLSYDLLFQPLHRKLGTGGAMLATFLASGIIHEIVITIPARGGYGGPTAYFVLQGLGLAIERSRAGKALRLRRGATGRLFAALMLLGPVVLLFPPPFVLRVILPFLHVIRAYPKVTP
jgi:D-alanyl-lipoteichoic acid acyltransferase DltB (MBOAT superfamily)